MEIALCLTVVLCLSASVQVSFEETLSLPVSDPTADPVTAAAAASAADTALLSHTSNDPYPPPYPHPPPHHNAVPYRLYAVAVHAGLSADSGHYYCYARDSDTDTRTTRITCCQRSFLTILVASVVLQPHGCRSMTTLSRLRVSLTSQL